MTRSTTATLAVAADYADAMMTARRAKNWLFMLLLLILLTQISLFFLVKSGVLRLTDRVVPPTLTSASQPTSAPAAAEDASGAATQPDPHAHEESSHPTIEGPSTMVLDILRYVIPVTNFLGIALMVVLSIVLLLLTLIMLVGRLIGVSHVTGAFIWSVLLLVLLFPWQSFLLTGPYDGNPNSSMIFDEPAFKIPGVLYTWPELARNCTFANTWPDGFLKWARFAGMPIFAVLVLLTIQAKSSRGLKYALGEADVHIEVSSPSL